MITGPSGRSYDPLPIDNAAGFPQRFPLLLNGVNYQFLVYVDAPEATLGTIPVSLAAAGATAAGSPTLQFAAVPASIFVGMAIVDLTTASAIPPGTTVRAMTATSVIMSQNAVGPGVKPGDRIQFTNELMVLPDALRFMVVRADVLATDGTTQTIFLRKVVPSLEYRARGVGLYFPTQIVALRNLNGIGNFGTNVIAGVASL
jgi:hypothetical protein